MDLWGIDTSLALEDRECEETTGFSHPSGIQTAALPVIHRPRPVPAEELLEHVWEHSDGGTANQVMCCIRRLRQKLAVGEDTPQYLHTVRGFGYRLCEPEGLPPTGVNEAEGAIDR